MNHLAQCQLITYMSEPLRDLDQEQLQDYLWLVEQQLQEIRQQIREPIPTLDVLHS